MRTRSRCERLKPLSLMREFFVLTVISKCFRNAAELILERMNSMVLDLAKSIGGHFAAGLSGFSLLLPLVHIDWEPCQTTRRSISR